LSIADNPFQAQYFATTWPALFRKLTVARLLPVARIHGRVELVFGRVVCKFEAKVLCNGIEFRPNDLALPPKARLTNEFSQFSTSADRRERGRHPNMQKEMLL
jgi:hypothetical protein